MLNNFIAFTKMITEERINVNYTNWIGRLKKYNCYSEEMIDEIGADIANASFALNQDSGSAYQGSMIDVVLNKLCMFAYSVNTTFTESHPALAVNSDMLMRVLLLQHISKCEMLTPETSDYWIKRGNIYKFSDTTETSLKVGERSIYLCQKYGIKLNELEYEAMRIIDKDDDKVNMHENPLAFIVKMANRAVAIEQYRSTNG